MSIRTKMVIFISVIMLVSVTLISGIWYRDTTQLMDTYLNSTAGDLMENAYNAFGYILTDTEYMLSMISLNEDNIIEPLKVINKESKKNKKQLTFEQLQNKRIIEDYIGSMYGYKYYITGISVISISGNEYKTGRGQQNYSQMYKQLTKIDVDDVKGKMIMLPPIKLDSPQRKSNSDYVVPAARLIKDKVGNVVGYAVMNFDYSVIDSMFSNNLPEDSRFQVVDDHGNTIFSNLEEIDNQFIDHKTNYVYNTYYASKVGWTFMMAIPSDAILSEINHTMKTTWILFGGIYIVLASLGITFVYRITKKIKILSVAMDKVAKGDLTVQADIISRDEIGQMSKSFNYMVAQIRGLMDKITVEEKKKREAEIDFLQAQINPHFLSNTLNVVVWMAKVYNANNIIKLTKSLITLLRSVMRRGDYLIPISEELVHVKSYIEIVEYSGTYDVTVNYDIDEDIEQLKILRFILQPIVENAFMHGVSDALEEVRILITIKKEENRLVISVEDNGRGMTEEQIQSILIKDKNREHTLNSIGIKNVQERIQLYFGEEYSIKYSSEIGKYTRASIYLPIIEG